MKSAIFYDKVGRATSLRVSEGRTILEVLRDNGIPPNAVITRVDGELKSEHAAGDCGPNAKVEFKQVRHYDLDVVRAPANKTFSIANPIYTKSVLFDVNGNTELRSEQYDAETFVRYVEDVLVHVLNAYPMMKPGKTSAIGLSGGRDSVAFLKLLERTRARVECGPMVAVTVTGLPDWEEPATFGAAVKSCQGLGIEHVVVQADEVRRAFQLRRSFVDIMGDVVASEDQAVVMVVTHHVMRRMVEVAAERFSARAVVLGLNCDDLLASVVTWLSSGWRMGPLPLRTVGNFEYQFPLFRLTKKELTLYLELVAPELNRQGAPGRFTTGPGERSLAYATTDHLLEIWPGFDYYAFQAFESIQKQLTPKLEGQCQNCGAAYCEQEGAKPTDGNCDVCQLLLRYDTSGPRLIVGLPTVW